MINVLKIQSEIMQHPEHIAQILEALEFTDIKDHGNYISFPNKTGDNASACTLYKDTLKYINWTRSNQNGNLLTLIMYERKCNFISAIKWTLRTIGLKAETIQEIEYPFHGFYRKYLRGSKEQDDDEYIYPDAALPPKGGLSKKFLNDGIPLITQEKWGVRFDHEDNAILIPVRNYVGELVGCKARNNDPKCRMEDRWWAYLKYPKSRYIYGWYENYDAIQKKNTVIVVEAEKSVMVLDGWGCQLGLAIGGHSFSKTQTRYIKSLMPEKIIVAFDQGLNEEEVIYETKKLIPRHNFANTKVGYIYDRNGDILDKNRKDAPVDLGKDAFVELMKNYVEWIEQ